MRPGLSIWDSHVLDLDVVGADAADRATGYADQTSAASGTDPYSTGSRSFFVCPLGFTELARRMAARVSDARYDHRVADVTRGDAGDGYSVHVSHRAGATRFETMVIPCDVVVVCVPPSACRAWTALRDHARSTLHAVVEGALCHVYVRAPHPPGVHAKMPDSPLAQTISSQYGNDWFQATYAGGRVARFWHHLRSQSVSLFRRTLHAALRERLGLHLPADAEHRAHYWPCAYHAWRPAPRFNLARAVRHAVEPNPESLPGVYLAGEAFSSHQAWMEGALETAELVLARHARGGDAPARGTRVDGRAVDVDAWCEAHPGGRAALENHAGEDLGAYMRHIGHSAEAWAFAHSMKR